MTYIEWLPRDGSNYKCSNCGYTYNTKEVGHELSQCSHCLYPSLKSYMQNITHKNKTYREMVDE